MCDHQFPCACHKVSAKVHAIFFYPFLFEIQRGLTLAIPLDSDRVEGFVLELMLELVLLLVLMLEVEEELGSGLGKLEFSFLVIWILSPDLVLELVVLEPRD